MSEKMTRSNSSACPEGHAKPVAAAASAAVGSGAVSSEPVALPFFAAGNVGARLETRRRRSSCSSALGTLSPPLTQT